MLRFPRAAEASYRRFSGSGSADEKDKFGIADEKGNVFESDRAVGVYLFDLAEFYHYI